MLKRLAASLLALTMLGTLLVSCGPRGESAQGAASSSVTSSSGSASSAESSAITLTDQAGRTVTLTEPAQRVVSAYYLSTSLLIALDREDSVVGIEMKADTRELYHRAAPQFLDLPAVGSGKGLNVEETAALNPDLVILPVKLADTTEQLDALGIPSLVIDPETMEGFFTAVDLIGQAVGAEDRAAQLVNFHKSVMEDVSARTAQSEDKPTVYIAGSDFLSAAGGGMYQNDLIRVCGGVNAAAELPGGRWSDISAEELVAWDPDYIFPVSYAGYSLEDVRADARFAGLSALEDPETTLLSFPGPIEAWDYPTASSALGILWLAAQLHPGTVDRDTYVETAQTFFRDFFDIELADEDLALTGTLYEG